MSCRPGVISIKTPSLLYSSDNVEKEKAWKVIHQFVFLRFSVVCFLCYNIIHSHLGEVKHSENLLESDNSRRRDIAIKRGQFNGKVNSLSQEFSLSDLVFPFKFWTPAVQASMEVDSGILARLAFSNLCAPALSTAWGSSMQTMMGRTMQKISSECSLSSLTPALVKKNMKYFQIPCAEEWRIATLSELLSDTLEIARFSTEEVKDMKAFLCTS